MCVCACLCFVGPQGEHGGGKARGRPPGLQDLQGGGLQVPSLHLLNHPPCVFSWRGRGGGGLPSVHFLRLEGNEITAGGILSLKKGGRWGGGGGGGSSHLYGQDPQRVVFGGCKREKIWARFNCSLARYLCETGIEYICKSWWGKLGRRLAYRGGGGRGIDGICGEVFGKASSHKRNLKFCRFDLSVTGVGRGGA